MVNWVSLAIPFAYLGVIVGSLYTFSYLYRKRRAAHAASLAPWFEPHLQRNVYLSLLHLDPPEGSPKVPDSVLRAALLRRATEDIHRIVAVRNGKQALSTLLQRGSVGDELWQRFQRAEQEVEEEIRDVVNEANAFAPNWGQTIFQSANEMANNALIREHVDGLQAAAADDKAWWDRTRAAIQADFLREIDGDAAAAPPASPTAAGARTLAAASAGSVAGGAKSDDDTVLVEAGGPTEKVAEKKGRKKKGKH